MSVKSDVADALQPAEMTNQELKCVI